ncbi:hypothetical protein [Xanthobacter oligotrophicus]|uniref:hypothetical protein n=1 Tax=Xanthobacter oligotrophicus TaxID=2607286 RepID=UPI0011F358A5|nr:hypothetical protein [Xanthobacter oligotrophicus]MCG5237323.1 hypothetical protein [Xanthobacter oligotrophicus]
MEQSPLRSANVLANALTDKLATDPEAVQQLKDNPQQIKTLAADAVLRSDAEEKRVADRTGVTIDGSVYKIVVKTLGVSVVLAVSSIAGIAAYTIYMHGDAKDLRVVIPDGLVGLASTAIGALAGLLTPVSRG